MMDWLKVYGEPIFQYCGVGTLSEIGGEITLEVEFEIVQLFDGRILCEVKSSSELLVRPLGDCTLHGQTEFGYEVIVGKLSVMSAHSTFNPTIFSQRAAISEDVTIKTSKTSVLEAEFPTRFLVTNFDYFSRIQIEDFEWVVDGYTINLRPLENHKSITKLIRASKSPGVTVSLTVQPTKGISGIPDVEIWATRFCRLLSLAQGCHIDWICLESTLDNQLVARKHISRPLSSPTGRQLIPSNPNDFSEYISQCLPNYVEREQEWNIYFLIDMYVRAVMTQPFPEPTGLHLAVLMDYMRGIYARIERKERLIDEETFSEIKKDLRTGFNDVLKKVLPDANSKLRRRILRHVGIFQFYPFSDSIKGMAKYLGLELDDKVVKKFVDNRDNLAHRYSFSEQNDAVEAINEMISFVSQFLLAVLMYEGYFYNWAIPPRDDWENRRVQLSIRKSERE